MPSTISSPFQTLLSGGTTKLALALRIVRKDAGIYAFTNYPAPITLPALTVNGITIPQTAYDPITGLLPTNLVQTADMKPDNLEFKGILDPTVNYSVTDADVRAGLFRDAQFSLIIFWWADTTQQMLKLRGNVADFIIDGNAVTIKLRSLAEKATQDIIQVTSPLCRYRRLGYNGCPFDLTGSTHDGHAARVTGSPSSITDARRSFIVAGTIGFPTDRFKDGVVKFTAGANAGLEFEVLSWATATGRFTLWHPTPYDITTGDTVRADSNCRLTVDDCQNIYNVVWAMDAEPGIVTMEGASDVRH